MSDDQDTRVRSVDRAVLLLQLVAEAGAARVTDLAGDLGVHKSTASRLLGTLEARGLVQQQDSNGAYRLGYGIVALAGAVHGHDDLDAIGRPIATELASELGETVNVVVRDGASAVCIGQVMGSSSVTSVNWVGKRGPLHATASGKTFLADLRDEEALELLSTGPLERLTPYTLTDPTALIAELRRTAERGWMGSVNEQEDGLTSVAAPIRSLAGGLVGALAVSAPSFRLTTQLLPEAGSATLRAADRISDRAGYVRRS